MPGSSATHFKCPNDRQQINKPAPGLNPRDWAEKFPTDTFIANLLTAVAIHEGVAPSGNVQSQTEVTSNSTSGTNNTARRNPARRRQVNNETQRTPDLSQYSHIRGPSCDEHPDREQGFFCLGCNKLVCPNCAVRSHRRRTCECVTIAEAMDRLQPRIQTLRRKFAGQVERVHQISQNSNDGPIQASKTRALNILNEMESRLGRFYENVLQQIEDARVQINEAVPSAALDNPQIQRIVSGVESTQSLFENLNNINNEISLLKDIQQIENQAKEYDTAIQSVERNINSFKVEFIPRPTFDNFFRNPPPIGTVKIGGGSNGAPLRQITNTVVNTGSNDRHDHNRNVSENAVRPTQTPRQQRQQPTRTRAPARITKVNCKDPTENATSWKLTGIAFVGTTAVIADNQNNMVRQVSVNGSVALNEVLPLDHALSVCNTEIETEVAVTQPQKRQISVVAADRRGGLRVKEIIRTLKSYEEIAYLPANRFVVSSMIGRMSIDVIDQAGHVLKSLERSYNFRTPRFLAVTSSNSILVSDRDQKELICVNMNGATEWIHPTNGAFPCGVACDFNGKIYLCLDNNTVVVLYEDGTPLPNKLIDMNDGLKTPYAICARQRQVAVTELGSSLFAPGSPWMFVIAAS